MATPAMQQDGVPPHPGTVRHSSTVATDSTQHEAERETEKQQEMTVDHLENQLKSMTKDDLPSPGEIIERLSIPDWKALEKKLVFRLDISLLPMLWLLYIFNYLDRASLG